MAAGATHLFLNWYKKGVDAEADRASKRQDYQSLFPAFHPQSALASRYRPRWEFKTAAKLGTPVSGTHSKLGWRVLACRVRCKTIYADTRIVPAGAGYVHGESVEAMKDAIEKLRFDGFTLGAA